ATLIVGGVQATNVGTYVAVVSSPYGSVASTPAQLNLGTSQCTPPPAGIIGWWQAEGNATDLINGNNGTPHGGISYGTGVAGEAFVADGVSGSIVLANNANLQIQNFTIEAWIQRSSTTLVTKGSGGGLMFGYGHGEIG